MGFQLSPGVNVSEIDLTTVIPSVSTTAGAIVGEFQWGPVNKRILVDSEITLVDRFGKPEGNNFVSFFSAANFLSYGNNLRVVRVANTDSYNASANTDAPGVQIMNEDDYELNHAAGSTSGYGNFYARYPGELGNSIRVVTLDGQNGNLASWVVTTSTGATVNMKSYFSNEPGTSTFAESVGGANDEIHIAVIDDSGAITGTSGTVLEVYEGVSKASDVKTDDGSSLYYITQITNKSKWIYVADHYGVGDDWGSSAVGTDFSAASEPDSDVLLGGGTTTETDSADYITGWDLFANQEEVDVSLLVSGNAGEMSDAVQEYVSQVAVGRKDCMSFHSPSRESAVNNPVNTADDIVEYRNGLNINTSYSVMDSGWKYQFDKYNNTYRYVPLNADVAGLCVYTDNIRDPWWSPAGLNRGQIKNVVKLSWSPSKTDRDTLYPAGVNPVVAFPGEGVVLYGDKTMQAKPSAFDRINVRRLFIVLEKAIAVASKYTLFEFNDEFTRAQFVALVEPFLRDVQGRRGVYDFRVVCDTTNNTPEVIDRNEFVGDIYIKPARSINYIQLNFVAVRTGVEFNEIVGRF